MNRKYNKSISGRTLRTVFVYSSIVILTFGCGKKKSKGGEEHLPAESTGAGDLQSSSTQDGDKTSTTESSGITTTGRSSDDASNGSDDERVRIPAKVAGYFLSTYCDYLVEVENDQEGVFGCGLRTDKKQNIGPDAARSQFDVGWTAKSSSQPENSRSLSLIGSGLSLTNGQGATNKLVKDLSKYEATSKYPEFANKYVVVFAGIKKSLAKTLQVAITLTPKKGSIAGGAGKNKKTMTASLAPLVVVSDGKDIPPKTTVQKIEDITKELELSILGTVAQLEESDGIVEFVPTDLNSDDGVDDSSGDDAGGDSGDIGPTSYANSRFELAPDMVKMNLIPDFSSLSNEQTGGLTSTFSWGSPGQSTGSAFYFWRNGNWPSALVGADGVPNWQYAVSPEVDLLTFDPDESEVISMVVSGHHCQPYDGGIVSFQSLSLSIFQDKLSVKKAHWKYVAESTGLGVRCTAVMVVNDALAPGESDHERVEFGQSVVGIYQSPEDSQRLLYIGSNKQQNQTSLMVAENNFVNSYNTFGFEVPGYDVGDEGTFPIELGGLNFKLIFKKLGDTCSLTECSSN